LHPEAGPARKAKLSSLGIVGNLGVTIGAANPKLKALPISNSSKWITSMVYAGINEAGLTCDEQTLLTTEMAPPLNTSADINVKYFCQWALSNFATSDDVRAVLLNGTAHIWGTKETSGAKGVHHSLRDALGRSIVVEYVGGATQVYQDLDDGGNTGYGVMTNEPEYPFMVRLVQHYEWKRGLARPAATMPGTWYPDHRFLRLHLVKSGMSSPADYREAIQQAVHTLNVVTVPMGEQIGTDSGPGEGAGDHTMWGVLYDHKQRILYWRTEHNQNLQRVRLADLPLEAGAPVKFLVLDDPANDLPWFHDATSSFAS
jgi:choloylglycine hydrolase